MQDLKINQIGRKPFQVAFDFTMQVNTYYLKFYRLLGINGDERGDDHTCDSRYSLHSKKNTGTELYNLVHCTVYLCKT